MLLTESRRGVASVRRAVRDDRAAEADGPAVRAVGEEDAFQGVSCRTVFVLPMPAAVGCVQDSSFVAHGPAFERVKEFHVEQVH